MPRRFLVRETLVYLSFRNSTSRKPIRRKTNRFRSQTTGLKTWTLKPRTHNPWSYRMASSVVSRPQLGSNVSVKKWNQTLNPRRKTLFLSNQVSRVDQRQLRRVSLSRKSMSTSRGTTRLSSTSFAWKDWVRRWRTRWRRRPRARCRASYVCSGRVSRSILSGNHWRVVEATHSSKRCGSPHSLWISNSVDI